jgi:hypothetical protein
LQVVDEINNYIRLINVASGTFAQPVATEGVSSTYLYTVLFWLTQIFQLTVTGGPTPAKFMIVQGEKLGEYA